MSGANYSALEERELNRCLDRILEILHYVLPANQFGRIELVIPRQNGRIAGEIEIAFRNRHKKIAD